MTALVTACSTTTKIQYLEPSEIPHASNLKQIAVNDFKDDSVGLTGIIESKLNTNDPKWLSLTLPS